MTARLPERLLSDRVLPVRNAMSERVLPERVLPERVLPERVLPERLLLVRHAMPEAVAEVPARDWRLGPEGHEAAKALRARLPEQALLVASDEPKAQQTLGAAVLVDAGFGEVQRPAEWVDDHRERARAYVQGARHVGWEPRQDVVTRFEAAVLRHATPGRLLVIGTHGMAATVWLAAHTTIDPGAFWAALRFPDLIDVDLTTGTVTVG